MRTNRFSSVTGVQFIEARGITAAKFLPLFFYDVEKGLIRAFSRLYAVDASLGRLTLYGRL
jgi:hypothetical protein